MIFEHSRFEIWNALQHPLKHTLADFGYSNPALPQVSNVESAINWILKVLYPNTKPAVATPANLPTTGNTLNDYRVVNNDGDGSPAGYRWEQREGDVAPKWYKIFDFNWSTDAILASLYDIAQDRFVIKFGRQDLDETGTPVTGIYAGQRIWGGTETNQNLTLNATNKDSTGFVQTDNTFRPTSDGTFDLGTSALKFYNLYLSNRAYVGDMIVGSGLIVSGSGAISFNDENLTTTGNFNAAIITASTSLKVGTATITGGNYADTSGAVSFGTANLSTTGTISGASGSVLGNLTFTTGSIASASGAITFGAANLTTTGTLSSGNLTATRLTTGNLQLDTNTLSATNTNGNLILAANGTGSVTTTFPFSGAAITSSSTIVATTSVRGGNITISGNAVTNVNTNGGVALTPNGTGTVTVTANFTPSTDNTRSLGTTALRFTNLFLSTGIGNGTNTITIADILSLRNINVSVANGMSLFFDSATSTWKPSLPDTEIVHNTVSGLTTGDAGHTQFAMLAGRSGGQVLQGGTAASENLDLESTSNATKGAVRTKDSFLPFTNASYSVSWAGLDLGGTSNYFRDIYTKGELKGARLENFTFAGLPAFSAQNVGRLAYVTDQQKVYMDTGTGWKVAGVSKFISDVSFDGVVTTKTVAITGLTDARNAIWQLCYNANDFARIHCSIKTTSASQVQIDTNGPLPAGSYRLIGIE